MIKKGGQSLLFVRQAARVEEKKEEKAEEEDEEKLRKTLESLKLIRE